jgi:hypothetical protein
MKDFEQNMMSSLLFRLWWTVFRSRRALADKIIFLTILDSRGSGHPTMIPDVQAKALARAWKWWIFW